LRTDLPPGAELALGVSRQYRDADGEDGEWVMVGDEVTVEQIPASELNGGDGVVNVDQADREALKRFRQYERACGPIKSPISEEVKVILILGGRQRRL